MTDEIRDSFAIAKALLDAHEEAFNNGAEDAEQLRVTLAKVIGALHLHGQPERTSKKPQRGVGYDFDEALIVESIKEHGSLPKAVQAHYPNHGQEWIDAVTRRIRGRMKEIGNLIGE